ncbi:MAG: hypothetical protein ACLQVN_20310, partial [Bryobacteraceae bacterium]
GLKQGFDAWKAERQSSSRVFPGLPYIALHSFSHLLLTAVALECGYPSSSIRVTKQRDLGRQLGELFFG